MGATERVARFAAETRFEALPARVVANAKRAILDSVGVMVAGAREPEMATLLRVLCETEGSGPAAVLGTRARLSLPAAALANGTAGHVLDYDDIYEPSMAHPSVPLLAALLPLAADRDCDGRALLAAYAVGYEVQAAIGAALTPAHYDRGWHSTSTVGTLSAAAGCASLLGLDAARAAAALGLAASLAGGLRCNFGTPTKSLHAGHAARQGLTAALLAAAGLGGSPRALEAECGYFAVFSAGPVAAELPLGERWVLAEPGPRLKPYPACGATHGALDALLALQAAHGFGPADVERIEAGVIYRVPTMLIHDRPSSPLEAKFSMPYCLAAALRHGRLGLAELSEAAVSDPETRALLPRVRMFVHPELASAAQLQDRFTEVTVTRVDGRQLRERVAITRGDPRRPLSADELAAKLADCVAPSLGAERAEEIARLVEDLETLGSVRTLVDTLCA